MADASPKAERDAMLGEAVGHAHQLEARGVGDVAERDVAEHEQTIAEQARAGHDLGLRAQLVGVAGPDAVLKAGSDRNAAWTSAAKLDPTTQAPLVADAVGQRDVNDAG
jgi:hypothetical protein